MLQIETRPVTAIDDPARDFILHSWVASRLWSFSGKHDSAILKSHHKYWPEECVRFLETITERIKEIPPILATIPEERDCYIGWIVGQRGLLDYVYVKWAFKRQGVARQLIESVCGTTGGRYCSPTRIYGFRKWLINNYWKEDYGDRKGSNQENSPSMVQREGGTDR